MSKKIQHLFASSAPMPSADLVVRIEQRIILEQRRAALRTKILAFSSALLVSCLAFIPALFYLKTEIAQSGFQDYLSLMLVDGGSLLAYWKEFAYSLLESIPFFSLVSISVVLIVFIVSLRSLLITLNREQTLTLNA